MDQGGDTFRLLNGILNSIPEPVVLVDDRGNVAAVNRASESAIGVVYPGRAIALSFRHPKALNAVEQVLAGADSVAVEVNLLPPTSRTFNVIVGPLDAGDLGGEVGMRWAALVFHDVTAVRRAEQMRADFVANASHELRSPLSALVGFIETLRGPARHDTAAQEKFLRIMADETDRMRRLIDDLLSLSAIEVNEHVVPDENVDLADVLHSVADALAPAADSAGVRVLVEVTEDLPKALGDSDQLQQIFRNLLENAIAYGGRGSVVRVMARQEKRLPNSKQPAISVAVADQGMGIPPVHIPRLTERFYRVDKARSREAGGTGLGLAIVKHIVNRHRGRLSIESVIGKGSTFTVLLRSA